MTTNKRVLRDLGADAVLKQRIAELEAQLAAKSAGGTYGEPRIETYKDNPVFVIPHSASTEKFKKLDVRIGLGKAKQIDKHKKAFMNFCMSDGKKL